METQQGIKRMVLEAQITRADGTKENLGPVAEYGNSGQSSFLGNIKINNNKLFEKFIRSRD